MIILGIETSCDETAAAVLQRADNRITILSNMVASSQSIHIKYGGIIPEQAAREQIKTIILVITESLEQANITPSQIDAIAVTQGPGLIGSLLVGVETAKTLSLLWQKPIVPVNHLLGHFYANWVETKAPPTFPVLGLLISGGHTDLLLFKDHGDYEYLGGTRDDAAGECFDKCARLLNLPYPGGPHLSKLAEEGNPTRFILPKPMWHSDNFDVSFSGLKTAVLNLVKADSSLASEDNSSRKDLAAAIEETIIQSLWRKVFLAAQHYNIDQIMVAGGVAANKKLQQVFLEESKSLSDKRTGKVFIPPTILCTDNAVMIAAASFFLGHVVDPLEVEANPNLSLR